MANITLITRSGKKAELTWDEMDNNLSSIAQALNNKQDLQSGLTDLLALSGTFGFLKKNGNSWSLDTNTYLTTVTKSDIGLDQVDNTSDLNKPISNATQTALDAKASMAVVTTSVDGLMSSNDKTKLDGVAVNANNYVHPSTDGSLHVPATGTTNSGKALVAGATAGSFSWTALAISHISGLQSALDAKQATLVSGTNVKTVNGTSILGTGDITIAAGGIQKARFTAADGQTAFVCTGITLNDPLVYLNGVLQDQGDVYTYSGSTVTFVSARYLNEKIVVVQ